MRFVLFGKFGADAFNSGGGCRAGGGSSRFRRRGEEFWKRCAMRKKNDGFGGKSPLNGLSSSRGGGGAQTTTTMASSRFSSSSFSSSSSSSSSFSKSGLPPMMKSALTSAGLGIVGDCVAQTLQKRGKPLQKGTPRKEEEEGSDKYDYYRTARQSLFNLTFYGPLQHVWYIYLGKKWPTVPGSMAASNLKPFATKVFLNQAALGPVVVACFFAWSQALTNTFTVASWTEKVQRDALPTLQKGWAFWVPASAINFAVVPVNRQVLYMSCCSIVWNCILSQAGNKKKDAEDEKKKKKKK
jgi:protein Mpv17